MTYPVPGSDSIRRLAAALVERLGENAIDWGGWVAADDVDACGWTLTASPRYLFSVSTDGGALPDGRYSLQISISENSLENGDIVHLGEVELDELADVTERYAHGEVVEQFE
ncbi:MAG TPA: hypothetical protein VGE52_17595 [Pirellulales bacterium]